jgi:hypothetical protein
MTGELLDCRSSNPEPEQLGDEEVPAIIEAPSGIQLRAPCRSFEGFAECLFPERLSLPREGDRIVSFGFSADRIQQRVRRVAQSPGNLFSSLPTPAHARIS